MIAMDILLKRTSLLVIDDDRHMLEALADIFEPEEFALTTVTTAGEGLAAIAANRPDAIILDVRLRDVSGFDLCAMLRESPRTRSIPVIMLTALTDEEMLIKGLACGADDYVAKPFSIDELKARVRAVLRSYNPA